jgi:hypothetical protein
MAPTFCIFLSKYIAGFMGKDYNKDAFDLKELDEHNKIEHDGSLIRTSTASNDCPSRITYILYFKSGEDIYFEPDTAKIAPHLIEQLLDSASGKDADGKPVLTYADMAKAFSQRQADSKANNPEFSGSFLLRMFGFGKWVCSRSSIHLTAVSLSWVFDHSCAAMALVFGGKVEHLRPFLLEERLVDGWVPCNRKRYGITMGAFNVASAKISIRTKTVPPTMVPTSPLSAEDAK